MPVIRKLLRLPELDFFEAHFSLINCLFPRESRMTHMEIMVLSGFMSLKGDIAIYRFGPSGRKVVMDRLEITPSGLSNYINSMLRKGILIKRGDVIEIFPILIPENLEQSYEFKLLNLNNE